MHGRLGLAVVVTAALWSASAWAAADTVDVVANLVVASNQGNTLQPPSLAKMRAEFAKKGLKFTSYRLLSTRTVKVTRTGVAELPLPNTSVAKLRLLDLKQDKATISIELNKIESKIQLGKEGSVFVHGGKHENGELIVALEPGGKSTL